MRTETPKHLFTGCTGELFDTRKPDWSKNPLRPLYSRHHRSISSGAQLRASLRAGDYAWPGGYALAYVCDDGGVLCPACVRRNFRSVLWSVKHRVNDGWRVAGIMSMAECDEPETCCNCNKEIA